VQIFAANRATGRVALSVGAVDGRSRRARVHEDGSLRVRFPNRATEALEAVFVNVAGGMTGGDRFSIDGSLGPNANLIAYSAAAEKIYRSTGAVTEIRVRFDVGPGARLVWLPQETILFNQARLDRRLDIELADDASLVMAEATVFGRAAMGEAIRDGHFADRWRVRRGGKLVFAENVRLDGCITQTLARRAVAAGGVAVATVLIAPGHNALVEAVRALSEKFSGEVGVSAWNDIVVVRFCARDGATMRRDLTAVLAALGAGAPRLWLQ
jgi:urease accessory protein